MNLFCSHMLKAKNKIWVFKQEKSLFYSLLCFMSSRKLGWAWKIYLLSRPVWTQNIWEWNVSCSVCLKHGFIIRNEKQCGCWSAGFIRSQMIWIYSVFKRWYIILKWHVHSALKSNSSNLDSSIKQMVILRIPVEMTTNGYLTDLSISNQLANVFLH